MKKRILILTLALILVLASVPAHAAGQRYTIEEFRAALEGGELVKLWAGLGGAWMDIADGETQVWINPAMGVYLDPEYEAPEGYLWISVYERFMAADGSVVWRLVGEGLVRAADMSLEQPEMPTGYGVVPHEEVVEEMGDSPGNP